MNSSSMSDRREKDRSNDTERVASMRRQFRNRKRRARKNDGLVARTAGHARARHKREWLNFPIQPGVALASAQASKQAPLCSLRGKEEKMKLGHGLSHLLPESDYVRFEID